MYSKLSRRQHLKTLSALGGMYPIVHAIPLVNSFRSSSVIKRDIYIFSKHLQWLSYEEMARTAALLGFDGIDLTVRSKGHVIPENVIIDLPKAVRAIRKEGLKVDLLTTAIISPKDPHTESILKTASQEGIKVYRMGWLEYLPGKPIQAQLEMFKKQLGELAEMNKHYGLKGAYQNHAGTGVGASLWDIWYIIKDLNPLYIGVQFDIRHAMVESLNSWMVGLKLLAQYINSLDIKDFNWIKKEEKLNVENVPVGKGIIDFDQYFKLLDELKIQGPLCLHLEYPLGGANDGAYKITIPGSQVTDALKSDLHSLRKFITN